jgi:hypothetical protein
MTGTEPILGSAPARQVGRDLARRGGEQGPNSGLACAAGLVDEPARDRTGAAFPIVRPASDDRHDTGASSGHEALVVLAAMSLGNRSGPSSTELPPRARGPA